MSNQTNNRYLRQTILPDFGIEGQLALKNAKVLVIGAGGLGSPVAVYLAAGGVGILGIVDFDTVDETNLHRQVFFNKEDVGRYKVQVLKEKILAQNPDTIVKTFQVKLDKKNAIEILSDYDLIVDGTDNFPTRYLVNDSCVTIDKPLVFGAIYQFEGQISVFNYRNANGELGPNYRDLFPRQPMEGEIPNCSEGGVIGVLPGIIGTLMAMEGVKILINTGEILSGKMLNVDTRSMDFMKLKINKSFDNNLIDISKTDYDYFCQTNINEMKSVTVKELKKLQADNKDIQIIDVREAHEYAESNMGAELMPLSELHLHINNISDDKMVIIHCRSGARSASAIDHLSKVHGFDNLHNLEGGIIAWEAEK